VRVRAHHGGHDRGVDHARTVDATHAAVRIDDAGPGARVAHAAGAARVLRVAGVAHHPGFDRRVARVRIDLEAGAARRAQRAHGRSIPLIPILEISRSYRGISERDDDRSAREKIAGRLLLGDESFRDVLPVLFDFLGVADPSQPATPMEAEAREALERASELAAQTECRMRVPSIHEARAVLAATLEDPKLRLAELREAYRLYEKLGATGHAERLARELASLNPHQKEGTAR
jgi:hypothetical protein